MTRAEREHGIGWAIKQMQRGHAVRRGTWGGTIRHLVLRKADTPSPGVGFAAHLVVRTHFDCYASWAPMHADLLARDWEISP